MRKLLTFGMGLSLVMLAATALAGTPAGGGGLFVDSGDGASSKLTVSGELRMRYQLMDDMFDSDSESYDRIDFADCRATLSLGFELTSGMEVKLTARGNYLGGGESGLNAPFTGPGGPYDDADTLDIYEAYARMKFALAGRESVLTVGRQELAFGSELVLGNDSKYVGLTYDAVRFDIKALENLTLTAFVAKLVENDVAVFWGSSMPLPVAGGDGTQDAHRFGLWGTYEVNEDLAVHGYVLYFDDQSDDGGALYGDYLSLGSKVWTIGAELALKKLEFSGHKIDAGLNAAFQFGEMREPDLDVSAYAVELEVGYSPTMLPWSPRFALGFAMGSGDDDGGDDEWNTFVAPAQDVSGRLGKADLFNLSNLTCVYLEATCKPMDIEKLDVGLAYLRFTATEEDDSVGGMLGAGASIFRPFGYGAIGEDAVADEIDLFVGYKLNENAELKFCFSWIEPDDKITESGYGNSPMQQAHVTLTVKF